MRFLCIREEERGLETTNVDFERTLMSMCEEYVKSNRHKVSVGTLWDRGRHRTVSVCSRRRRHFPTIATKARQKARVVYSCLHLKDQVRGSHLQEAHSAYRRTTTPRHSANLNSTRTRQSREKRTHRLETRRRRRGGSRGRALECCTRTRRSRGRGRALGARGGDCAGRASSGCRHFSRNIGKQ